MRYWRLNAGTAVESYSHDLDLPDRIEITKEEFDLFIAELPAAEIPEKTDIQKVVEYAKSEGWI